MNFKNICKFFFLPLACANFVKFFCENNYFENMKKISLVFALIFFASIAMYAQKPIKWRTSVKMINTTEGVITMKAIIQQGWHLYGTSIPSGGPKATSFNFSSSVRIKLVGEVTPSYMPKNVFDKSFNINLNWWDKTVTFTQKFKLTNKANAKVVGAITYMGCNDQTCLPPSTQSINIAVPKYNK